MGSTLGAVRVREALAARRIDGARQFFTQAYDFGPARSADEVFKTWVRDSVVGDIVTTIRSFRPHVIIGVFPDSITDGNGQHRALPVLLDHAFTSAADPRRFPPKTFGTPWPVAKLYRQGTGIHIETAEADRMLGVTYAELGRMARAQQRTQGLNDLREPTGTSFDLERIATRVDAEARDSALFGSIDTSFARLGAGADSSDRRALAQLATFADSARRALDVAHPDAVVPLLARVVRLASDVRRRAAHCRHPSMDARSAPSSSPPACDAARLDLDAAIDLVRERANGALMNAAGIRIATNADRELLARSDTASVEITITNQGVRPFAVFSIDMQGAIDPPQPSPGHAVTLAPDSTLRIVTRVHGLETPRPWWITQRTAERYDDLGSPLDGIARGDLLPVPLTAPGPAIPEEIRRTSDVRVLLDVDGATIATSVGPAIYQATDPRLGVQARELAGIADVTFRFPRMLQWVPVNKPFSRVLRVGVKSNTDMPRTLGIGKLAPQGVIVDAIPKQIDLAPHEQRDFAVPIRGTITRPRRLPFGIWGTDANGVTNQDGFQLIERDYLAPVRIFRSSGVWLQAVDVVIPSNLTVLYVPEGADDVRSALQEVGVQAREVAPEVLLTVNLSQVSTIVLAAHALERYPELAAQTGRLAQFVRNGGTLVIERGTAATASSPIMPWPITVAKVAEQVGRADAPVRVLDPAARVLHWPNRITAEDWNDWIMGRAQDVPTTVDPRYTRVIETHDPGAPENSNTILLARMGKGMLVYTTLTLDEQIGGGVSGALRLMINLLSAGLPH
jgi:LmbE family N-acetylglucosaminyl deacetylase